MGHLRIRDSMEPSGDSAPQEMRQDRRREGEEKDEAPWSSRRGDGRREREGKKKMGFKRIRVRSW